ncbi:hypothetical protein POVCU2_0070010 [Plasmodium ovale curtisi]|uniref:Trafficking protein particle complex subunit 13 N-terminal domain-containing protein n=1 Tax=Plasmodium ovale curtisi TaxID=864141 RepID=A0A1A8WNB6_PLAOA|nr:hypothetical protein POVCU2_0070010 [Plasmodium ovale curtisi]SBS93349.1 hypothetical protein POVCU1_025390 [Plasmodium ovale curtisi]
MNENKEGVKVELLRLCPPVFNHNIWNLFKINEICNTDFEKNGNIDDMSLSNEFSLSLPINYRKIFIGQDFKSQITISNNLKNDIQISAIHVEVLTRQNTFSIYQNVDQINVHPNSFFNFVTSFAVNFLDIFTMHCVVEYFQGNEKKKLKKDFNFICKNPFNLKTVILHKKDKVYIEVVLKNVEEDNIMVNDIKLKDIKCELIKNENEEDFKMHNGIHYFKQNDEYSMIFCVSDEESKLNILRALNDENITNIEIIYFTNTGGKGLYNLHFLKKSIITDNIRIYLEKPENAFYLVRKMYKFEIVFENNTDQNVLLEIFIHNNSNIHVVNNFVKAHTIEEKKKVSHFFYVLFINPGIHFFNKITIYNKKTKKKMDYIKLFKLFVK